MQISLKQARRVEREIGAELELNTRGGGQAKSISIYEDLTAKVDAAQTEMFAELSKFKTLTKLRFAIRKAIETQNENAGLNTLMNREAELRSLAKVYTQLMGAELTDADLSIISQRHAALKVAAEKAPVAPSRYGEPGDAVTLGTMLRTSTLETLRAESKMIQRELLVVVDKLSSLNATCTVTLVDSDVKALEAAGIIAGVIA